MDLSSHLSKLGITSLIDQSRLDSRVWDVLEKQTQSLRREIEWLEQNGRDSDQSLSIRLCIHDTDTFEALVCCVERDRHVLCISYGTFAHLLAIFYGILENDDVLTNIWSSEPKASGVRSKSSDETESTLIETYSPDELLDIAADLYGVKGFPLYAHPEDRVRLLYAQMLANLACEFVFWHEIAHVMLGHTNYVASRKEYTPFHHFRENADVALAFADASCQKSDVYKTVEYAADLEASEVMIKYLFDSDRSVLGDYAEAFGGKPDLLQAFCFSMRVLFHIVDELQERESGETSGSGHYPSYQTRLYSTYSVGCLVMQDNYGDAELDDWMRCFAVSKNEYDRMCNVLRIRPRYDKRKVSTEHYAAETDEMNAIDETRARISDDLAPHRYGAGRYD